MDKKINDGPFDLFDFYEIDEKLGMTANYEGYTLSSFCSDIDQFAKDYIINNINEGDILLEIGVHGGFSLLKTFDLIKNKNIALFGIDCWEDIEKIGINGMPNDFFTDDSLQKFLNLHKKNRINLENIISNCDPIRQINIIKGFSFDPDLISKFDDESIGYLYIDGDHSYKGCYNDLKNWYSKVKKGGLVLGDDGNLEEIKKAVNDFCSEKNIKFKMLHNKFYFIK